MSGVLPVVLVGCAVCMGDPDSLMVEGAKAGVLVLAFIIVSVLGGITAVAIFWARRARALDEARRAPALALVSGLDAEHLPGR